MKIGIIKKDKTKIEIESLYEIQIKDRHDQLVFEYISIYSDELKEHVWESLNIEKKDIQIIYFGGWND